MDADSEVQKTLALLVIYGSRGLTQRELALANRLVPTQLIEQGLVTVKTRLFSRTKVYVLSREGKRMHTRATETTQNFIDRKEPVE